MKPEGAVVEAEAVIRASQLSSLQIALPEYRMRGDLDVQSKPESDACAHNNKLNNKVLSQQQQYSSRLDRILQGSQDVPLALVGSIVVRPAWLVIGRCAGS